MSQNDQVLRLPLAGDEALEPPAEWERLRAQCPWPPSNSPAETRPSS
ncbi:hypothetical protein [Streptomyces fulvoviolaceus]|nr:hypothetical protein [Streptomyces fulvoviolaceus]MCT9081313.1 hypothetical protein [Streptomyces fulvoviolaceus]